MSAVVAPSSDLAGEDGSVPEAAPRPAGLRARLATIVPVPTTRASLVAAVGVGLVVALPPPAGLLVALVVVVVAVVVDALLAPPPWSIGVAREHDRVVALGGALTLTWHLANPGRRNVALSLADELVPSLGATRRRAGVVVPARGRAFVDTQLRPVRRGAFRPSAVTVRVAGPLGLGARQHTRALPGLVEVHPAFPSRNRIAQRLERSRELDTGLRSTRGRGVGTDFDSLREYGVDDDVRRIDWGATARAGTPIVRTYHEERNQRVLVLLDTGRTMAGLVAGVPRLDHAMDAILGLTTVATHLGDKVGLVAFGARVRATVAPEGGRGQAAVLSGAMFALDAELAEAGYRAAFAATLARFRRRALLVVVTDLHAEAVTDTLLPALPMLVRRHVVVVAAVRDPVLRRWAHEVPEDAAAAYRAAAAATSEATRDAVAARLRAVGALVVDAGPDDLAGRLADTYLSIKATGRL